MTIRAAGTRSRLDPEPVARRDVLGLASLLSAAAALLLSAFGMLRLPKPGVLASAGKKYRVSLPEALPAGEPYTPPGRAVALFRDAQGVWAVSLVCTHLGCIVRPSAQGFECPCHGSRFGPDGSVIKGPAPKALPWLKVTASGGGFLVDEGATVAPGTRVSS